MKFALVRKYVTMRETIRNRLFQNLGNFFLRAEPSCEDIARKKSKCIRKIWRLKLEDKQMMFQYLRLISKITLLCKDENTFRKVYIVQLQRLEGEWICIRR